MSVELEVKIGDQVIRKKVLFAHLSKIMRDTSECNLALSWEIEHTETETMGCEPDVFNLTIGDVAEVQCFCYTAGSEEDLGYEGGWWLCVSVVTRNPNSFLLMLVVAACVAIITGSEIVDDSNLLGENRTITSGEILSMIGSGSTRSLFSVAKALAQAYGVKMAHTQSIQIFLMYERAETEILHSLGMSLGFDVESTEVEIPSALGFAQISTYSQGFRQGILVTWPGGTESALSPDEIVRNLAVRLKVPVLLDPAENENSWVLAKPDGTLSRTSVRYMYDGIDILSRRALAGEDFEEASDSLQTLRKFHPLQAREVALQILHERIGDVYYQAFAFDILYAVSLHDAIEYIGSHADCESAYVLGSMLDSVTDDIGALESREEIQKAASLLHKALANRSPEDLSTISSQKAHFDEAYR
jgi:hypothetical protein